MMKWVTEIFGLTSTPAPENDPSAPDNNPSAPDGDPPLAPNNDPITPENDHSDSHTVGSNLSVFDLEEIKRFTLDFSPRFIVSEDISGKTYRPHNVGFGAASIRILDLDIIQGSEEEWLAGVMSLAKLRHHSLVKLEGYCCKDEHRILVYEYCQYTMKGSLGSNLFDVVGGYGFLTWTQRLLIAIGTANSLAFLLGTDKSTIAMSINCINTSSILLDHEYRPKLMHFKPRIVGHGRLEGETRHVSIVNSLSLNVDTEGHDLEKDVLYRYGVVLMEMLTASPSTIRQNRSNSEQNLIEWNGRELKSPQDIINVMDRRLQSQYSKASAKMAATLAYNCLGQDLSKRHTIGDVIKVLELLQELDSASSVSKISAEKPIHNQRHGDTRSKGSLNRLQSLQSLNPTPGQTRNRTQFPPARLNIFSLSAWD